MADKEALGKARQKLSGFGIDLDAIMGAIAENVFAMIEQRITDLSTKVDAETIAIRAANLIPPIDVGEVVDRLAERLPDSGSVEAEKIADMVRQDLTGDLKKAIEDIKASNDKGFEKLQVEVVKMVRETYAEEGRQVLAAVREKFMSMAEELKNGAGSAAKAGGRQEVLDRFMPLLERIIDRQDPLDAYTQIMDLRNKLYALEPQGPSPDLQFKTISQAYIEGRRHQANLDKAQIASGGKSRPLPSGPTNGPSTGLGIDYSKVDRIVAKL